MDPITAQWPHWLEKLITTLSILVAAIFAWFARKILGHDSRLSALETAHEVNRSNINNLLQLTAKSVQNTERFEQRHREDIARAYDKIEQLQLVIIRHLADERASNHVHLQRGKKDD